MLEYPHLDNQKNWYEMLEYPHFDHKKYWYLCNEFVFSRGIQ
jgi:hypothetical protein